MTIRHHQPLQVIPGEADPTLSELPDAGFPDSLVVFTYDYDYDALEWVKHSSSAGGVVGGGLTNTELRASAVAVAVAGLTFSGAYAKVMAVQEEGGSFAVTGGYQADSIAANVGAVFMPTLPAAANAAEPTLTEGKLNPLSMDLQGRLRAVTTAPGLIFSLDYDVNNNPIYRGLAAKGSLKSQAVWQILKMTPDGSDNITDGRFANASEAFDQVWDNRAALAYS